MIDVLILVLMEDTLGVSDALKEEINTTGLNPCSNGRYSRSMKKLEFNKRVKVLILVLMEDTLGDNTGIAYHTHL